MPVLEFPPSLSTLLLPAALLLALACDPGGSTPELDTDSTTGAGQAGGNGSAPTPVELHGQLRVDDGKLVGEHGDVVELKGASSMWLNWENNGYAESLDALVWMRDHWNLSVIRAAMGVEPAGAYLDNTLQAKQQVTTIVDNAIVAGVYVIVDWHDHNAHLNQVFAEVFFAEIADEYAGIPNILYEPFNEPEQLSWRDQVKPYHEAVVREIREHDPNNVIILGTPNWSQYVDEAASDPVVGDNLLYTLHFYACTHDAWLRERGDAALDMGVGLFVTEWGATHADGGLDGEVCLAEARLWTDWMRERSLSWTAWKLDNCTDASCYFVDNGVPADGGWTEAHLQGHGPFVVEQMRR